MEDLFYLFDRQSVIPKLLSIHVINLEPDNLDVHDRCLGRPTTMFTASLLKDDLASNHGHLDGDVSQRVVRDR